MILQAAERALARPGVVGVTMRALADELGADPTAVYRHFRGKEDLLAALTDHLLAPLAAAAPTAGGWREQLDALAVEVYAVFERSPGAVAVLAESPFTPMTLRALESTVAVLVADGLPRELAVHATQAVVIHVVGHATSVLGDPEGFWSGMADVELAPTEVPLLRATAELWRSPPRQQFRHGLDLLLDGIAASVAGA